MSDTIHAGDILRFRPRTVRQFLIFSIAYRFDDLRNLGRYLNACITVSQAQLIEAARAAEDETLHTGSHAPDNFWRRLDALGKEGA